MVAHSVPLYPVLFSSLAGWPRTADSCSTGFPVWRVKHGTRSCAPAAGPRPFVRVFLGICHRDVPKRQPPTLPSPSHKVVQHFVLVVIQPVASYRGWVTAAGLNGWVGAFCNALSRAQAAPPAHRNALFSFSAKLSLAWRWLICTGHAGTKPRTAMSSFRSQLN